MVKKLLLIGWDGADWKVIKPLIERREMPTLAQFIQNGVQGDLRTLEPMLSPMLWNSIATGKLADKHGVLGFTEVDPHSGEVRPVTCLSRKVKAVWNILTQQGYRTHVINWFGGHPAEPINGVCVSDVFPRPSLGPESTRLLSAKAIHPDRLYPVLADMRVKLGEIEGEMILSFVPKAAEVDQKKDRSLVSLAKILAETYSVHNAATYVMSREPWEFMAVYYPALDHFSHSFMRFHPPKLETVEEKAFELYHDVINSAYRFHDRLLQTLLYLAGEDTMVILVSDHGFHPDHLRPRSIPAIPAGPAVQHRPLGILAMKGPAIKKGESIFGASLLDITPTILALLDQPIGRDMDGRILIEAFDRPPRMDTIPSWETVDGEAGQHPRGVTLEPGESHQLLEQFIALGYVEKLEDDQLKAVAECLRESQWNLARVYLDTGRLLEALPLLESIHEELPERPDFALSLALSQLKLGLVKEAEATLVTLIDNYRETPAIHFVLGLTEFERGNYRSSLTHLQQAQKADPGSPWLHLQIGNAYLKMRQWIDAEGSYRRALDLDPHLASAYLGLAAALLRQKKFPDAGQAALQSIECQYHQPLAHFYLGIVLAHIEYREKAIQAFETALRLKPPVWAAHRWLAEIYHGIPGNEDKVTHHRRQFHEGMARRHAARQQREAVRREAANRAAALEQRIAHKRQTTSSNVPSTDTISPATEGIGQTTPIVSAPLDITIVTGLPRSGTSLMMQLLEAGGMPVLTDGQRKPDDDNPEGYYEWEPIKKVARHPEVLRQADRKAIKVISFLLPALPRRHQYHILFMDRPISEVVASQTKMIRRHHPEKHLPEPSTTAAILERHRARILHHVQKNRNCRILVVDYPALIRQPDEWIPRIVEFLGAGKVHRVTAMKSVIRPELHRHRLPSNG